MYSVFPLLLFSASGMLTKGRWMKSFDPFKNRCKMAWIVEAEGKCDIGNISIGILNHISRPVNFDHS